MTSYQYGDSHYYDKSYLYNGNPYAQKDTFTFKQDRYLFLFTQYVVIGLVYGHPRSSPSNDTQVYVVW